jgi:hypothetical protein
VGAITSVQSPAPIAAQAACCAGVAEANVETNQSWVAGWNRLKGFGGVRSDFSIVDQRLK